MKFLLDFWLGLSRYLTNNKQIDVSEKCDLLFKAEVLLKIWQGFWRFSSAQNSTHFSKQLKTLSEDLRKTFNLHLKCNHLFLKKKETVRFVLFVRSRGAKFLFYNKIRFFTFPKIDHNFNPSIMCPSSTVALRFLFAHAKRKGMAVVRAQIDLVDQWPWPWYFVLRSYWFIEPLFRSIMHHLFQVILISI